MARDKYERKFNSLEDLKKNLSEKEAINTSGDNNYNSYKKRVDKEKKEGLKPDVDKLVDAAFKKISKESGPKIRKERRKDIAKSIDSIAKKYRESIGKDVIIDESTMSDKIPKSKIDDKKKGRKDPDISKTTKEDIDKTKKNLGPERNNLNEEEKEIQKAIYKQVAFWRNKLKEKANKKTEDKELHEEDVQELKNFELNPYGWMERALKNGKTKLINELKNLPENKENEKKLREKMQNLDLTKRDLDNLNESFKKKIPLNIERSENTKDAFIDDGIIVSSGGMLDDLNKYLKRKAKYYEVGDVFQRGSSQYLVLKNSEGEEHEINVRKLNDMVAIEALSKRNLLKEMKSGDQFEIVENGKPSTYMIDTADEKEVIYKNEQGESSKISREEFEEYLSGLQVSLRKVAEGEKKSTGKSWEEIQKEFEQKENEIIGKIAEMLKDGKISQIILHSQDSRDPGKNEAGEDLGLKMKPDLDTRGALFLLHELNKKWLQDIYEEGAMTSFIKKGGKKEDLTENNEGIRLIVDAGGNWLGFVDKDGKTIDISLDHHGTGKRKPTSATEMVAKIMEKADMFKEKPEWLENFIKSVNEIDNLTYTEEVDKSGEKIFNKDYFEKKWPYTVHAIAEKIPFETLIALFESGKIKDPSHVFTKEELEGDLGKTVIGEKTIAEMRAQKKKIPEEILMKLVEEGKIGGKKHTFTKEELEGELGQTKIQITLAELCKEQEKKAVSACFGVKNAIDLAKKRGLKMFDPQMGKIVYFNPDLKDTVRGVEKKNTIPPDLAFLATKALGSNTYISFREKQLVSEEDKKNGKKDREMRFMFNSDRTMKKIGEDLGTGDVRGTFIFSKSGMDMTEKEFLIKVGLLGEKKIDEELKGGLSGIAGSLRESGGGQLSKILEAVKKNAEKRDEKFEDQKIGILITKEEIQNLENKIIGLKGALETQKIKDREDYIKSLSVTMQSAEERIKEINDELKKMEIEQKNTDALKDIEGTAKALEKIKISNPDALNKIKDLDSINGITRTQIEEIANKFMPDLGLYDKIQEKFNLENDKATETADHFKKPIAVIYHEAKENGSNPELVKALEELIIEKAD